MVEATGSSSFAELLDPIATAPGSDTSFDTLSKVLGYFHIVRSADDIHFSPFGKATDATSSNLLVPTVWREPLDLPS